jgi:hypothetical protein
MHLIGYKNKDMSDFIPDRIHTISEPEPAGTEEEETALPGTFD